MKDRVFGVLQRIGRSFMLPIAVLPVAGLLLGIGSSLTNETAIHTYGLQKILGEGTILYGLLTIMNHVGSAIFGNLPLIFAVGVATGMAKREREVAALSALIAFLVMHVAINAMLQISGTIDADGTVSSNVLEGTIGSTCGIVTLEMGVFGGIIVGIGVAMLHNRFYRISLPNALSFFAGSRFVPIISTLVYLFVGILMYFVWPVVQNGIYALGGLVTGTGYLGTLIFGLIKRALIPFGLHHVFYMPFWQTGVGGTMEVAGKLIQGGQNIFFAQLADPSVAHFSADATRYFSGEFIFMIFGLPGAALAMYRCAKPQKRRQAGGLLLSAALTCMFTGITEPIEFSFLFAAPVLFAVQVILAGSCYMVAHMLNIAVGLTFSGGLIDFILFGVLQGNVKTSWLLVIPCGIVYFLLYYFIFSFFIKRFDLKTPGREEDDGETKLYSKADYQAKQGAVSDKRSGGYDAGNARTDTRSALIVSGLGGKDNITEVDCCATRLRVGVKDAALVNEADLKATECRGIIKKGNALQIIYGPHVSVVKSMLEDYLEGHPGEKQIQDTRGEKLQKCVLLGAPMQGKVTAPETLKDGVFSEKMLGEGIAVEPVDGKLYAPADGIIDMVFETKHAIGMTIGGCVQVLMHMGIDTVALKGKYFDVKVRQGEDVRQGQLLAEFDKAAVEAAGYRTVTPMVITNSDQFEQILVLKTGDTAVGDIVLEIK